jgi:hypothetical protein
MRVPSLSTQAFIIGEMDAAEIPLSEAVANELGNMDVPIGIW